MNFGRIKHTVLIGLIILSVTSGCSKVSPYQKMEGMIWNTNYHITFNGPRELKDSVLPVLNEVGKSLSVFDDSSLVSRLNNSDSVKADRHLLKVYEASLLINAAGGGSFDPTISPLVDAWGFGRGHTPGADTLAIDSILKFVGINLTHRNGDYIVKDDIRTQFNFSAIAKGYGCDAVGEMFQRNGVADYMVEIGGEITLHGVSPSGGDWNIAIDAPVEGKNPGEETAMVLALTDCGIATSGNYRNFHREGDATFAHTISPSTGRPVIGKILSASVVAPDCMTADGVATACMASDNPVITLQKSGCEGVLIFPDSIWVSPGLSHKLRSLDI